MIEFDWLSAQYPAGKILRPLAQCLCQAGTMWQNSQYQHLVELFLPLQDTLSLWSHHSQTGPAFLSVVYNERKKIYLN